MFGTYRDNDLLIRLAFMAGAVTVVLASAAVLYLGWPLTFAWRVPVDFGLSAMTAGMIIAIFEGDLSFDHPWMIPAAAVLFAPLWNGVALAIALHYANTTPFVFLRDAQSWEDPILGHPWWASSAFLYWPSYVAYAVFAGFVGVGLMTLAEAFRAERRFRQDGQRFPTGHFFP